MQQLITSAVLSLLVLILCVLRPNAGRSLCDITGSYRTAAQPITVQTIRYVLRREAQIRGAHRPCHGREQDCSLQL